MKKTNSGFGSHAFRMTVISLAIPLLGLLILALTLLIRWLSGK